MQVAQLDLHLLAQLLVERRERLVQQQDARLEHDRARQRHALPLAAGELVELRARQAPELDQLERAVRRGPSISARGDAPQLKRKGDVLCHAHVREQRVVLEHHADVALVGRRRATTSRRRTDAAAVGPDEARQHHQQRGLAASPRARAG